MLPLIQIAPILKLLTTYQVAIKVSSKNIKGENMDQHIVVNPVAVENSLEINLSWDSDEEYNCEKETIKEELTDNENESNSSHDVPKNATQNKTSSSTCILSSNQRLKQNKRKRSISLVTDNISNDDEAHPETNSQLKRNDCSPARIQMKRRCSNKLTTNNNEESKYFKVISLNCHACSLTFPNSTRLNDHLENDHGIYLSTPSFNLIAHNLIYRHSFTSMLASRVQSFI